MEKSPFIQKISDGRTDLIIDFVKSGGTIDQKNDSGASLIQIAAYYGDVSAIKFLIEHGEELSNLGVNSDLNGAAFHGHWRLVQYLLEQGADPNCPHPKSGEYPLHVAISKANSPFTFPVVQVLLDLGAMPNVRTSQSAESGCFMRDAKTCGESALHRAAAFANEKVIELLLNHGADKEIQDAHGNSPLSWASWHLRPGSILRLLAYGKHSIHPLHVERMKSDHGFGPGAGIMTGLIGQVHTSTEK